MYMSLSHGSLLVMITVTTGQTVQILLVGQLAGWF